MTTTSEVKSSTSVTYTSASSAAAAKASAVGVSALGTTITAATGLSIAATTEENEFLATWSKKSGLSALDSWTVRWGYCNSLGQWIYESDASIDSSASCQSTYSAPDAAVKIVCYVKGVASEVEYSYKVKITSGDDKGKWTVYTVTVTAWKSGWAKATACTQDYSAPDAVSISSTTWTGTQVAVSIDAFPENDWGTTRWALMRCSDGRWANQPANQANKHVVGGASSGTVTLYDSLPAGSAAVYTARPYTYNTTIGTVYGDFSEYSPDTSSPLYGVPLEPSDVTACGTSTDTGIDVSWSYDGYIAVQGDVTFEIRWSTAKTDLYLSDFGNVTGEYSGTVDAGGSTSVSFETGLDLDEATSSTVYVAVRAVVDEDDGRVSDWVLADALSLGSTPDAPTMGTVPEYVERGEAINVTWRHNCADGCAQAGYRVQATAGESRAFADYDAAALYGDCVLVALTVDQRIAAGTVCFWAADDSISIAHNGYAVEFGQYFAFSQAVPSGYSLVACFDVDGYALTEFGGSSVGIVATPLFTATAAGGYTIDDGIIAAESATASEATDGWTYIGTGSDSTSSLAYDTSELYAGAVVAFRARTEGLSGVYGDWGYTTEATIVAPMTLSVTTDETVEALPVVLSLESDIEVRRWHIVVTTAEECVTTGTDGDDILVAAGTVVFEGVLALGDDGFDSQSVQASLDSTSCTIMDGVAYDVAVDAVSIYGTEGTAECSFATAWGSDAPQPYLAAVPDDGLTVHLFPACYETTTETTEATATLCASAELYYLSDGETVVYVAETTAKMTKGGLYAMDGTTALYLLFVAPVSASAKQVLIYCEAEDALYLVDDMPDADADGVIDYTWAKIKAGALGTVYSCTFQASSTLTGSTGIFADFATTTESQTVRDDVTLAVYRTDTNGDQLLIADGIANTGTCEIIDAYPNFGTARYRVAATAEDGTMGFWDASCEVECSDVVLQFSDGFNVYSDEDDEWASDCVRLPFNIELSESYSPDVELVEYIGNSAPTMYAGTQRGATVSASGDLIWLDDADSVAVLRRFAGAITPAYYRDPSGLGFWASVEVALESSYESGAVGVSLEVTRIDGDYSGVVYPDGLGEVG